MSFSRFSRAYNVAYSSPSTIYPFEYNADWVLNKSFSWNEIDAVRAFLLFNSAFQIEFSNNFPSEFTPTFSIARIPISLRTRVERYGLTT